ncbi:hypothetical protein QWY85_11115 [Neolewinella lacunae]|uniref:Lipoprotein n=1 Tax=Neolewinella lacunae TaxID=1517758 RepID=A0A923PNG5_9BACT|nr:hypothetical protein [Neolewinella lacunae]MBC6995946.1 hypothetical protein [Neolewinella lacunae]MDN3635210.1 hypothetical protein [Neolewinella lacunae]
MIRLLPALALLLLLFSSCGPRLSPLTQRLIDDQNWSEDELKRIQFYLSEDLVLTRELRNGNSEIRNGQVKIVDGREVEQMVFKRNTPGVFVFSPKTQRMGISFERNDEDFLVFGPNPKAGDRYTLLASDWNRNSGTVTYAGKTWRVNSSDAYASLLIPLKRLRDNDVSGRVVGGRKL